MKKKEDDSISTSNTNSSSINKDNSSKNEEEDIFHKSRTRSGIKNKANNFQPGRATISVPLSSLNGISHNASFQSKLLFFNGGKPRPKFKHIPYAHERVPEDSKKNSTNNKTDKNTEKNVEKKTEKKIEKKKENDIDDIESNININQILESKNKISKNDNKINNKNNIENKSKNLNNINNKEETEEIPKKIPKKNTIYVSSSHAPSLSLDYNRPGFSKIQKEEKTKTKKDINIKLKSLNDQWSFQKILLDYNILDFTSKFKYLNI